MKTECGDRVWKQPSLSGQSDTISQLLSPRKTNQSPTADWYQEGTTRKEATRYASDDGSLARPSQLANESEQRDGWKQGSSFTPLATVQRPVSAGLKAPGAMDMPNERVAVRRCFCRHRDQPPLTAAARGP